MLQRNVLVGIECELLIGCDVNGTELGVLSIRVVEWSVDGVSKREKRKESLFSSGTSRPRVGFLARLEINPVGMNPFHNAP